MNKHLSEVTNEDCMEGMARYPDNYFDLAIVDPPYGIGEDGGDKKRGTKSIKTPIYNKKNWDSEPPKIEYFNQLLRVSKNQIIWGANHFIKNIPYNSSCWIVWDKDNTGDFADAELAYTSFKSAVRIFKFRWNGMLQQNMKEKEQRIHPTQKPVALYKWLLQNYAKQGDKILDTHLGSGSSRIAAYEIGFDFTAFELDKEYFEAQEKRYKAHIAQLKIEFV
jgi:site-specific DNA-methyltransferase (adenine-specific)